jgi:4-diphosphocytidyl-2C-methyl-D-erythritol kinase
MLRGGFARMTGRGEQVWRLPLQPKLYFLLLCPATSVSTGKCYALYDELVKEEKRGSTEACINSLLRGDNSGMGATFYNSLYLPACKINPSVQEAVESLAEFSPLGYGMTGSGSCAFALFESRELCEWAKSRYRGKCRAIVVKTVDPQEEKEGFFGKLRNPYYLSEEEKKEAEK